MPESETINKDASKISWTEKPAYVIALIVIFFPVGLYGLYKSKAFQQRTKHIIAACFAIFVIVAIANQDDFKDGSSQFHRHEYSMAIRTLSKIGSDNTNYDAAHRQALR